MNGWEIEPKLLKESLGKKTLIDVREPWEFALGHLSGSVNIPLGELEHHLEEIAPDSDIVAICHHGIRSLSATAILRTKGFQAQSLKGGVHRWSDEIDPSFPKY